MRLILLLFILTFGHYSMAQEVFRQENLMSCDATGKITLVPVNSPDVSFSGKSYTWSFNGSRHSRDRHTVNYVIEGDTVLTVYDSNSLRKYLIREHGIYQSLHETPQVLLRYDVPLMAMPGLLSYNDSVKSAYLSSGKYCDKYQMGEDGCNIVRYDGYGKIIENGRDTIHNVARISTAATSSVCLSLPNVECQDGRRLQKIEEAHTWIDMKNGRILYRQESQSFYENLDMIGTTNHTYRFDNDTQAQGDDDMKDDDTDRDEYVDKAKEHDIINYTIDVSGEKVCIEYSLTKEAEVSILLCDVMGVLYFQDKRNCPAGCGYNTLINTSGLKQGNYVIYVNANGEVHSDKIMIRQ